MDKDSYYRGFSDACDVVSEFLRGKVSKKAMRELREFADEQVRRRKALEILGDMAA